MPLFKRRKIGDHSVLGIWECSETLEELLSLVILDAKDRTKLAAFTNPKRKIHFLSVRVLFEIISGNSKICYDENGKPFQKGANHAISISHSHDFVAILISPSPFIGIDIQRKQDNILRIRNRFINEFEKRSFDYDNIDDLTLIWCAKECVYKIHGDRNVFFKEHMTVERVIKDDSRIKVQLSHHLYPGIHRFESETIGNHVLVYSVFD